ncbi:hypothetical protein WJX72_001055 [[Myrmecia] bisecta]|uniref:cellulase n=1 Tax=[Myrmecia] bisecta TaxID=41462 RepID=A0AAW1QEN8_9CHLO
MSLTGRFRPWQAKALSLAWLLSAALLISCAHVEASSVRQLSQSFSQILSSPAVTSQPIIASVAVPTPAPAAAPANGGSAISGPLFCAACDTTYDPVCGQDDATYGNACVLECAKVPLAYRGKCSKCQQGKNACGCTDGPSAAPVCADGLTWSSACDAGCNSHLCWTPGVCNYTSNQPSLVATKAGLLTSTSFADATSSTQVPDAVAARYNYAEVLHKTFVFFESQKSGNLTNQRLAWRSDSCADCIGDYGEDLTGGYYESGGSYLKLGMPAAHTVAVMGWGLLAFHDGYAKANETTIAREALKWGANYLVNAYNASANRFAAVVGNDTEDFDYYGPPEEYRAHVPVRPVFYISEEDPGSEISGEAAAALAVSAIVFQDDVAYSTLLLQTAKSLYTFATSKPRSYMDSNSTGIGIHKGLYPSTGFYDELAWAAAWLYKATSDVAYLADAQQYYQKWEASVNNYAGYTFENGEKGPALHVLLAQLDSVNHGLFVGKAKEFFDQYLSGSSIPHNDRGLSIPYHWGATRPTTAAAFLALVHAQAIKTSDSQYAARLFNYAQLQINYLLGDSGRSWVVGHGSDFPQYIWHKQSYNSYIDWPTRGQLLWMGLDRAPLDKKTSIPVIKQAGGIEMVANQLPQRHICYGYLFAAPTLSSELILARKDYTYAEATTDGSTCFAGALAGLASYFTNNQTAINDCQLDLGWTHPNATMTPKSVNNTAGCSGLQAAPPPAQPLVATQG